MTLEAYSPEQLDQLALRALDICSRLRCLAQQCRSEELPNVELHDKKALEWLGKLEAWIQKTEGDLRFQALKQRGRRRATSVGTERGEALDR